MELNRDFLKQQEDELSLNYVDLTQNVARNLLSQMQRRCLGEFAHVGAPKNYSDLRPDEFYLCQIDEITFEEKAPQKDAVENVLGAFRAMKHINVIYCLLGDKERVRFFLGVSLDRDYEGKLSANTCGREILEPSIRGNIRGCVLQNLSAEQKEEILKQLHSAKSVGMMEGIPSIDAQKEKFQGTDRLIDVMQGDNWGMVVVASPFTEEEVRGITEEICKVADQLTVLARFTSQRSTGANVGVNETDSFSNNRQKSQTSQTSESKTHNHNTTRATDVKDDNSCQIASTISNGHSKSDTQSFNESESATTNDTKQWSNGHPSQTLS